MMHGDEQAKSQLPGYIFSEKQLLPINDTFSASDIVVYCSRSGIYSTLSHLLMSPLGGFFLNLDEWLRHIQYVIVEYQA